VLLNPEQSQTTHHPIGQNGTPGGSGEIKINQFLLQQKEGGRDSRPIHPSRLLLFLPRGISRKASFLSPCPWQALAQAQRQKKRWVPGSQRPRLCNWANDPKACLSRPGWEGQLHAVLPPTGGIGQKKDTTCPLPENHREGTPEVFLHGGCPKLALGASLKCSRCFDKVFEAGEPATTTSCAGVMAGGGPGSSPGRRSHTDLVWPGRWRGAEISPMPFFFALGARDPQVAGYRAQTNNKNPKAAKGAASGPPVH